MARTAGARPGATSPPAVPNTGPACWRRPSSPRSSAKPGAARRPSPRMWPGNWKSCACRPTNRAPCPRRWPPWISPCGIWPPAVRAVPCTVSWAAAVTAPCRSTPAASTTPASPKPSGAPVPKATAASRSRSGFPSKVMPPTSKRPSPPCCRAKSWPWTSTRPGRAGRPWRALKNCGTGRCSGSRSPCAATAPWRTGRPWPPRRPIRWPRERTSAAMPIFPLPSSGAISASSSRTSASGAA